MKGTSLFVQSYVPFGGNMAVWKKTRLIYRHILVPDTSTRVAQIERVVW